MIPITINGERREIEVEPDKPLLWVLREELALVGTKYGCGVAACGACTVHVDGQAIFGEITIKNGTVEQANFPDYEVVRLADMPVIETLIVGNPDSPMGGVGEPGTPPIAPAVGNAIFALTGKRLRSLPFKLS